MVVTDVVIDFCQCLDSWYTLYLWVNHLCVENYFSVSNRNKIPFILCYHNNLIIATCKVSNVWVEKFQLWIIIKINCTYEWIFLWDQVGKREYCYSWALREEDMSRCMLQTCDRLLRWYILILHIITVIISPCCWDFVNLCNLLPRFKIPLRTIKHNLLLPKLPLVINHTFHLTIPMPSNDKKTHCLFRINQST